MSTQPTNPANVNGQTAKTPAERKRTPFSAPVQRLQVADIPGYHLFWPLESQVPRALAAGYEFVTSREVQLNNRDVAGDATVSGNADLGDRVRVYAGIGATGQPEYHVLMKIKEEWYQEDQKAVEAKSQQVMDAIYRTKEGLATSEDKSGDKGTKYVKTAQQHVSSRR